MKLKSFLAVAAAFAVSAAAPAIAQPVSYICDFKSHKNWGWIPEKAIYEVDLKNGQATAIDGLIYEMHKDAIPVEFERASEKRVKLRWEVLGVEANSGNGTVFIDTIYSMKLNMATMKATLRVLHNSEHGGVSDPSRGSGKCRISKD